MSTTACGSLDAVWPERDATPGSPLGAEDSDVQTGAAVTAATRAPRADPRVDAVTMRTPTERLRAIQRELNVEPDGLLGPQTLTALETLLSIGPETGAPQVVAQAGLTLTTSGIDAIVRYEIGSRNYYQTRLRHPHWPGGDSGVTIGIGYDLGYQTADKFEQEWQSHIAANDIDRLRSVCGKKRRDAKLAIPDVHDISISYNAAIRVFTDTCLVEYAGKTSSAFPGVADLAPDAQSALVSLVFNRGAGMRGESRREMREIKVHVAARDYAAIAGSIESMKRLWEGRNLDGLLKRRDAEAAMVRGAAREYDEGELVRV